MAGNSFYDQISANKRNSYLLMIVVFALVVVAVAGVYLLMFGFLDDGGLLLGVILSAAYIFLAYTFADRMVLSLSGAREAKKNEFPYLVNVVEGLSIAAGIPAPKIYIIDDPGLNAFATGTSPQKASVAFTTGLLQTMNRQELEGVAAHEISHIKNFDCRMSTLVIVMVGLIAILSDMGIRSMFWGRRGGDRDRGGGGLALIGLVIIIIAPIVAQLVRLALSRQREYLADASGAQLTRYPPGLASALEKIRDRGSVVARATETTAPMYFAVPVSMGSLFSTHPPIEERIKKLKEM